MCGLFGIIDPTPAGIDTARARLARDTLVHRGPDQAGDWCQPGVYMGHRRLSILDTSSAGRQPMEADGVAVTVNGEIYNFRALKAELQQAGFAFHSSSDSEVVLHGYRHWGVDGLTERLEGMYAAVIYDNNQRTLFAFRDRVGIKPLFYFHSRGCFAWASEPKAIKAYVEQADLNLDPEAIIDFLVYRYIPAPKTAYKALRKLPAAHILEYRTQTGQLDTRPYWRLPEAETDPGDTVLKERLRELLDASIRDQLVSDVPLGLLLSGGIDSSAIAAVATRCAPNMQSFSIGFREQARDETPFATAMAERAGTTHHTQYFERDEMNSLVERMDAWFDEPFGDTSAIPTFRVCAFARRSVTVALSGDGGDELFGGYRWYERYDDLRRRQRLMPGTSRGINLPSALPRSDQLTLLLSKDPLWSYARIRGSITHPRLRDWKQRLEVPADYDELWAYRAAYDPAASPRKAAQRIDFHTYLPDDILTKVDRASMAVSLECRPALLSTELVEFAFTLPERFLYRGGELKGGFKWAVADMLPSVVLDHAKQGFSVPDFGWRNAFVAQFGSVQEGLADKYLNAIQNS